MLGPCFLLLKLCVIRTLFLVCCCISNLVGSIATKATLALIRTIVQFFGHSCVACCTGHRASGAACSAHIAVVRNVDGFSIDHCTCIVVIHDLLLKASDDLLHLVVRGTVWNSCSVGHSVLIGGDRRVLSRCGVLISYQVGNFLNLAFLERLGRLNNRTRQFILLQRDGTRHHTLNHSWQHGVLNNLGSAADLEGINLTEGVFQEV